jgi:hypothetical protein
MSIDTLKQQILAQNTTSKWSGEGFGSAEANAADMAKILDSIGITDIKQFGQFEKVTGTRQETVLAETDSSYPGFEDTGYARPTGRYYIPQYGPGMEIVGKTFVDPSTVTERIVSHGFGTGPHYAASVPITETVYGNKVTGQVVPSTYGERQTGNAWGGTFAGSGNTGYRVQFDSAGNPYFYTTGASSSDLGSILPIASLALSFAVPGLGTAIGSALGASGAAATAIGNAVIGGVMSEASGGDFLQGALTSGAGSLLSGVVNPAVTEAVGSQAIGNALTSGVLSELQGGDFAQGALSGALSGAISDAKLAAAEEYLQSLPGGYDYENVPQLTEADVLSSISGDYQYETPNDAVTPVQTDVPTIQTPTLTANDVVSLISGETSGLAQNMSNLESQLTTQGQDLMNYLQQQGLDYQTALDEAITAQETNFGTALNQTTEDILSQLASQGTGLQTEFQSGLSNLAEQLGTTTEDLQNQLANAQESWSGQLSSGLSGLESQLTTQGKDFMDYLQQQGLDYETALNEAIATQGSEFGTALNQTTENILAQLAEQGSGLQTEFQTGLQDLADQLGISQQELQDQLNQYQEDWGTQLSGVQTGLESKLSGLETSLAESTLANKLAMLDAMKAIGGLGLSLTGINGVMQSIQDQVTPKTYEFTPVDTSGWKSPVAAQPVSWQAPTPINFGSRELLKGTQWQSPVNIGQVINTLNSAQPAPFVMPSFMSTFQGAPTVGTGEIIGELGGKPVSIADIVAGIQSGQTYPSTMG